MSRARDSVRPTVSLVTSSDVDADELLALYRELGWHSHARPDRVAGVLANSDILAAAFDRDGRLVAFARVLTDHVLYAMVHDVMVAPRFQRRGLGSELVRVLLAELTSIRRVSLTCDPGVVPFYERLEFEPSTRSMDRYQEE